MQTRPGQRQTWLKLKSSLYFKTRESKQMKETNQINKGVLGRLKDLLLLCMPENVQLFRYCANNMTVLTGFQKCLSTRRSPSEGGEETWMTGASCKLLITFLLSSSCTKFTLIIKFPEINGEEEEEEDVKF